MIREMIMAVLLPAYVAANTVCPPEPAIEVIQEDPAPVYEYVGDYRVTAYAFYEGGGENYATASGAEPVPYYTVATGDEFEFGTQLYIEDIGIVEVQDRGSFPEGTIDLHIGWDSMESFDDRVREVYVVNY